MLGRTEVFGRHAVYMYVCSCWPLSREVNTRRCVSQEGRLVCRRIWGTGATGVGGGT